MHVNPERIRSFASAAEFETWLSKHHASEPELWIKIHKKASGLPSVTAAEAIDVVLCWGWIDGLRKGFDERSFLQRYTPRTAKSTWSQINQGHVARLIAAGRMTKHGQREIDVAKKDGRWKAAYGPMRDASPENVPADLRKAIAENARAQKCFDTLNRANLFAMTFRVSKLKTAAGRARQIETLVAMLARGETILPIPKAKTSKRG
ncbi:MAG: YdeI/OmpD-associated family protein [Archangium sp.]|nr:YdeI/OmpD-associated family protein [Archangium sp.]